MTELKHADIVRKQFGQQAGNFSQWEVTHNENFLRDYFRFLKLSATDELLDVACGTGDFALYCAERIAKVRALDISPEMLELGRKRAVEQGLSNIEFGCRQVEDLNLEQGGFSIVSSKAAFHHFPDPGLAFRNMAGLCRAGGRVAINDIVAYDDPEVDAYFEALEKAIDDSHYKSWSRQTILDLYRDAGVPISRSLKTDANLDVEAYISHAVQSSENAIKIRNLLDQGINHPVFKNYFSEKEGRLYFLRPVLLVMGNIA